MKNEHTMITERCEAYYRKEARWLMHTQMDACSRCGATGRLYVHHKDGWYNNNSLCNLKVVCPSCHRKEHGSRLWFGYTRFNKTKGIFRDIRN